MTVRAKFQCLNSVPLPPEMFGGSAVQVYFAPVYGDGSDNAAWSKATPSGELRMTITNPDASSQFMPGRSYWLDFTPAE